MPRPSPSGPKPEKNMSSRLLTMKFMQRAAATAATKGSSQPESKSESKESTPKKRRVSGGPQSPGTPSSDLEAISAALAEEEARRRDAVSRQAAEAGETEWVLDFGGADNINQYTQQPVVLADYSLDADDDDLAYGGRQIYGNYKRNKPKASGNGEGGQDSTDAEGQATNNQYKSRKVNLDSIVSISGAGGRPKPPGGSNNEKSQKKRKHK
ncbi:hypothetical protein BDV12DRAFT_10386 [Aspergillus spectabilis]